MITEIISLCVVSYLVNGCASQKYKNDDEFENLYQKEKKSIEDKLNSNTIKGGMERWNTRGNNSLRKIIAPELKELRNKYNILYKKLLKYNNSNNEKNEKCFTGSWDNYHCHDAKTTLKYCEISKKINPGNRKKVLDCCKDICQKHIELKKIDNKLTEYENKLKIDE
jgi:hypothetical protein